MRLSEHPYPGTLETLSRLGDRGAGLAVVTNKLEVLSRQVLDALDLTHHFKAIVCGDTLPVSKPDPGPALHACEVLGIDIADSLFVGDSNTDVECARAAGCAIVCMRYGYNHGTPAEQLGADAVIPTTLAPAFGFAPGRSMTLSFSAWSGGRNLSPSQRKM